MVNFIPVSLPERKVPSSFDKNSEKNIMSDADLKYVQLYNEITAEYGIDAGEHILRGFKKSLNANPPHQNTLKPYQQNIINEACRKLGISFTKPKNVQE